MRIVRIIAALSITLAVGGCGHFSNCAGWKQLGLSPKDSNNTKREVTEHNAFGKRQGCPGFD